MKSKFLGFLLSIISITSVYSQMDPETFYLKGNLSFIPENAEFLNDDFVNSGVDLGGTLTQFSVSVGLFFHDNFMVGINVPLNYQVNGDSKVIGDGAFIVSLQSKYYFDISPSEKWKLTLEGQAGYGQYSYEESVVYSYKIGPGVSYFLNDKLSVDFTVLYGYESLNPESDGFYQTGYKALNKGVEAGIGVSAYF